MGTVIFESMVQHLKRKALALLMVEVEDRELVRYQVRASKTHRDRDRKDRR